MKKIMTLANEDFGCAATRLSCDVATIKTIATFFASPHGAFLPTGEPVILFDRRVFSKLTAHKYDVLHPDISSRQWGPVGPLAQQHLNLKNAMVFDRAAALQSCSWGLFMVDGNKWKQLGYPGLEDFVEAMYRSEQEHLEAFIRVIEYLKLARSLQRKDWSAFLRRYIGPNYLKSTYANPVQLIADEYERNSSQNA